MKIYLLNIIRNPDIVMIGKYFGGTFTKAFIARH